MDRLISAAWKAFWVGLGASGVLIAQSMIAPAPATPDHADPAGPAAPPIVAPAPAAARPVSLDPILSRNMRSGTVRTVRGGAS